MLSAGLVASEASAAATPCADLQIANVAFSPTEPVAGQAATVAVTITNAGTCAAGGFVTQFSTAQFGPVGASDSIGGLAAGASTTLDLPYTFEKAGNFQTIVQVNTSRSVSETNYANDLAIAPVTVLPAQVSLAITHFSIAPVTPNPTGAVVVGQPATATFVITNSGDAPAGPFDVQWTPFFLARSLTQPVTGLAPGASTTVTITYTFPFTGTVTGSAVVINSATHFAESKTATLQTVVEPDLPNLAVATGGIKMTPAPVGSQSTLSVTIVNNGNADAGNFVVSWQPWFLATPESQQVSGLAEGQSTTVTFTYDFPFAGTFSGTVTLNSTNSIAEVTKKDDTAATSFAIPAATVDLTVTGLAINPSSPTQGAPATVTVTVQNLGNSPSGTFMTSWNPDAFGIIVPGNQTLSRQMPSLAPGASTDVTFSFTYPQPGNFRSVADVQTLGGVVDTNPSNNERLLNVTVQPAQLDLVFSSPTITFNPPSPVSGNKATATVSVVNNGPIASGPFAVELQPQAGGFPQFQFINGLNVGESRTLTFNVEYFTTGTFTATATVDPFNEVVRSAAAKAQDVINQSVKVVPPSATLNVTLDHLHVINNLEANDNPCLEIDGDELPDCGSGEWDNIRYLVFDPGGSCDFTIDANALHIHQTIKDVACMNSSDGSVNNGDDIGIHQTIQVTLVGGTPLIAAAAAVESDILIPDFAGVATFVSTRPKYLSLSGLQQVPGVACTEIPTSGKPSPINGGHCFDAFYGVSVVSVVGDPPAAPSAASVAAAESTLTGAFTQVQTLAEAAAAKAHVGAGAVQVSTTNGTS